MPDTTATADEAAMTPQRLAEIHEAARRDYERGTVAPAQVPDIVAHRAELLAEAERLAADVLTLKTQRVQIQDAYCDLADYAHAMETERNEAHAEVERLNARMAELEDQAGGAIGRQAFAQMEADELRQRSRTSNDLARQLADRTDELETLQRKFNDQAELCGEHSAELSAIQVRLEDADAAVARIGDVAADLVEKAKASRTERDEARQHIDELQDKLASMPDVGKCCCSLEGPGSICMVHSPTVNRLTRERDEARGLIEGGTWEWAWQSKSLDGPGEFTFPASNEKEARDHVKRCAEREPRRRFEAVRRLVGEWRPADGAGDTAGGR